MNDNFEPITTFLDIIFFKTWNKSYTGSHPYSTKYTVYGIYFWLIIIIISSRPTCLGY